MIELIWVSDRKEAQNQHTKRTLLWERWSGREANASPFGICLRPADPRNQVPPFQAWEYRPAYLSEPLCMHIVEAGIEEPMWIYLNFMRRSQRKQWFTGHPAGIREITGLTLTTLAPLRSTAARRVINDGVLRARTGAEHLLEIEFDGGRGKARRDFRPQLPLRFHM